MVNCDAGRRPLGLVAMEFTRDFSAAQSAGSRQIRQAFVLPTFIATRQSDTSPPSRLTWCVLQVCPKFLHRLTAIAGLTHHKLFTSSLLSHCFQSPLRLRKSVHNSSSSSIENISSLVVVSWATKKDLHTKSIQLGCATPTPHRPLSESAVPSVSRLRHVRMKREFAVLLWFLTRTHCVFVKKGQATLVLRSLMCRIVNPEGRSLQSHWDHQQHQLHLIPIKYQVCLVSKNR